MRSTNFIESDILFIFKASWKVRKYDAHPFYQAMSGLGMSAVDFVGISDKNELFLMEVKNYCNRPEREQDRILEKIELPTPKLANALLQKIEETKTGIRAISTYLNKKWWHRMAFQLLNRPFFTSLSLQKDRLFWMKAQEILEQQSEQVQLILWLELPDNLEIKRNPLIDYLHRAVEEGIEIYSSKQFSEKIIQSVDFAKDE